MARVTVRVTGKVKVWLGSMYMARVVICPSEPSRERVEVCHLENVLKFVTL